MLPGEDTLCELARVPSTLLDLRTINMRNRQRIVDYVPAEVLVTAELLEDVPSRHHSQATPSRCAKFIKRRTLAFLTLVAYPSYMLPISIMKQPI